MKNEHVENLMEVATELSFTGKFHSASIARAAASHIENLEAQLQQASDKSAEGVMQQGQQSISLRDHFAGLAMTSLLHDGSQAYFVRVATHAYLVADAMLLAREA